MPSAFDVIVQWVRRGNARWRFFHSLRGTRRVLDLGCGAGANGLSLTALHPDLEVHGVDVLEPGAVAPGVVYRQCDLDQGTLPYADEFFDAVILTHVIEHLREPMRLGPEIRRVMKRGASIYVETPNWTSILVPSFGIRRDQHNPFNFFDDPTHVRPWTKQALYDFFSQACGLRVRRVGTVRNWLRVPLDIPAMLAGLVSGRRHVIVAAFWNLYGWCIFGTAVKE